MPGVHGAPPGDAGPRVTIEPSGGRRGEVLCAEALSSRAQRGVGRTGAVLAAHVLELRWQPEVGLWVAHVKTGCAAAKRTERADDPTDIAGGEGSAAVPGLHRAVSSDKLSEQLERAVVELSGTRAVRPVQRVPVDAAREGGAEAAIPLERSTETVWRTVPHQPSVTRLEELGLQEQLKLVSLSVVLRRWRPVDGIHQAKVDSVAGHGIHALLARERGELPEVRTGRAPCTLEHFANERRWYRRRRSVSTSHQ